MVYKIRVNKPKREPILRPKRPERVDFRWSSRKPGDMFWSGCKPGETFKEARQRIMSSLCMHNKRVREGRARQVPGVILRAHKIRFTPETYPVFRVNIIELEGGFRVDD